MRSDHLVAFAMVSVSADDFDHFPADTLSPLDWDAPLLAGSPVNPQDATEQAAKGLRMILEEYESSSPRAYHLFVNGVPEAVPGVIAEFWDTALTSQDSLTLFYATVDGFWIPTLTLLGDHNIMTYDNDIA